MSAADGIVRCRCGIASCRGGLSVGGALPELTVAVVSQHGTGHLIVLDRDALTEVFQWLYAAGYEGR